MKYIVNSDIPRFNYMLEWYRLAKIKFSTDSDFLDLTAAFDKSNDSDFIDHGHLGPYSGKYVALPIANRIRALIH